MRRKEQPVRPERAANLDERAGQIVDELQRQRRHHEIERAVAERQRLLVGRDRQRSPACAGSGSTAISVPTPIRERRRTRVGRRAKIDRELEPSQDRREPLGEIVGGAIEQEGRRTKRGRPHAAGAQQRRSKMTGCGIGYCRINVRGGPPPQFISAVSCRP